VANILARRFSQQQILYDKYHRPEFARTDLAVYLPGLYLEEADLVVVVICKNYQEKEWTGLEWNAVLSLRKQRKDEEVMLCRFDLVEGKGLLGLAGYLDLDDVTPPDAARFILERLAINEGEAPDYYTKGFDFDAAAAAGAAAAPAPLDWPEEVPDLQWPVADHTEAREAFGKLITRQSPFRYLPISGPSELGKSHLTKQLQYNANKIEHLRYGRFDFKGSADIIEATLPAFVSRLDVDVPKATGGVTGALGEVITELARNPRPTLLIFDTFEQAGKAEQWMEGVLLNLLRYKWMRVVIVGQKVPPSREQVWSDVSAPEVILKEPSPQEWLEYGRRTDPTITIDTVEWAYKKFRGKAGSLAQLLGPQ